MNYIVYHGTNAKFNEFSVEYTGKGNDQIGSGFYFADRKEVAEGYGNNILKCEIEINNPIRLTKDHVNLRDYPLNLTAKQVAGIIKLSPNVYDMDETCLWNFSDISRYSKEDLDFVIDDIAEDFVRNEYDNLMYLEDFYRDYPTEFRTAINKVLGYDGVIQTFDDGNFYVCWFPEQIKIIEKIYPDKNKGKDKGKGKEEKEKITVQEAGYNWNKGMSNNAVHAYNNGEMPISKWNKSDLLKEFKKELDNIDSKYLIDTYSEIIENKKVLYDWLEKQPKEKLQKLLLDKSSWHHTSSYYNETDFYRVDLEIALDKIYQDNEFEEVLDSLPLNEEATAVLEKPTEVNDGKREDKAEFTPVLNDNFKRWFGNSKVVDDNGQPLVCYHGSTVDIEEFSHDFAGQNTGNNLEKVFYFTSDKNTAITYCQEAKVREEEWKFYDPEEKQHIQFETEDEFFAHLRKEMSDNPKINPSFIRMEKPYIYDANYSAFDYKRNYTMLAFLNGTFDTANADYIDWSLYEDLIQEFEEYDEEKDEYIQIKPFDYDGVIILNVRDDISDSEDFGYIDEYIVWNPNQIKSIYNRGNWSFESNNVFESLNNIIEKYL